MVQVQIDRRVDVAGTAGMSIAIAVERITDATLNGKFSVDRAPIQSADLAAGVLTIKAPGVKIEDERHWVRGKRNTRKFPVVDLVIMATVVRCDVSIDFGAGDTASFGGNWAKGQTSPILVDGVPLEAVTD